MAVSHLRESLILLVTFSIFALTFQFHLLNAQKITGNLEQTIVEDEPPQDNIIGKGMKLHDISSPQSLIVLPQNITILEQKFNAGSLLTDKYMLLIKNGPYQIQLWKLSLETFNLTQIPFPFYPQHSSFSIEFWTSPKLLDLKNGDVALSFYDKLFIINNETFQIKQTMQGHDRTDYIRQFYIYQDIETGSKTFLVNRQELTSQLVQMPSGQYETKEKIMFTWQSLRDDPKLTNSFYLDGLNSAVYLEDCSIRYISTLDSIVDISYDHKYYFHQRIKVAVSYDELFFVLKNPQGFFEFYNIGDDYDISLKKSVFVEKGIASIRKGATTTDDAFVFAAIVNVEGQSNIAKVDPAAGKSTFVAGQQTTARNMLDFNLFNAHYDRLVTLEQRQSDQYFLQLRTVTDLSLIFEYPLTFGFPILDAKLVGSPVWNQYFTVALKFTPSRYDIQNDTKLILFSIEGDRIAKRYTQWNVSFDVIEACHKYIVNYKSMRKIIRIYKHNLLNVYDEFMVNGLQVYDLQFEKNIFIIRDFRTVIYDFQKSLEEVGSLYTSVSVDFYKIYSIVLPKRGLLYQATTQILKKQENPPTKLFFNISYPSFQSATLIQTPTYSQRCEYADYYLSLKDNCNFVFFINCLEEVQGSYCRSPRYVKYKECSKEREEYPIEGYEEKIADHMHFISSDRKYIIALLRPFGRMEVLLDIRPLDNLSKTIFHKIFGCYETNFTFMHNFYVDLIRDSLILIRSPEFITAYFIRPEETNK